VQGVDEMPGGDGTGPQGTGPLTGRGDGFCILRLSDRESLTVSGFTGVSGEQITRRDGAETRAESSGGEFIEEVSKMPGGNGTGPSGMGPMTGRARGFCTGNSAPGYTTAGGGRGARGRGRGLGFRRGFSGGGFRNAWPIEAPTADQELDGLKHQAEYLGGALESINKRIEQIKAAKNNK